MPTVIPVKFEYATHDFWFDPAQTGALAGDHVICSTERGTEIGLATYDSFEVTSEELGEKGELKPLLRVATEEDLAKADELATKGEEAMPTFRRLVDACELDMKPVGVEYLFGGEKVVCYFAAEERVDFRQLVRDLARELHEKIDMRQIGVREEAAVVGGFAHCGQELCCARFGKQFEPVSIRMAKEQDLPLNSSKISGACGRLMCCLRYEFEAYRDFKSRAPKKNAVIETPLGKAKIAEYNTPKEELSLRLENGKLIRVPLAEMSASEAACKKSEELGCVCRPDTVSREVLEKLNSPEVQMALAELDREMGVLPPETFDESDIFVEPSRTRRRAVQREATADEAASESAAAPKKRRRRGARTHDDAQASEQAAPAAANTRQRRRRRHHSETDTAHEDVPTTNVSSEQAAAAPSATHTSSRRTRRPGDRGGEAARAQQAGSTTSEGAQEEATSPRRRRRRHSRPSSNNSQTN